MQKRSLQSGRCFQERGRQIAAGSVHGVADDRMPLVGQVNTYLMRSSGLDSDFEQ